MIKNKITGKIENSDEIGSYDLSISDLMSALCAVFLLFLSITVLQLNKQKSKYEQKNSLAEKYIQMQASLYNDLKTEFTDFQKWNIEITPDLTFHFKDTDVLFSRDSSELKPTFKDILQDFFPKLVSIIMQEEYKDSILEIRIEGHTARNKFQNAQEDYKTGMELSEMRVMNVLLYCIENIKLYDDKKKNDTALRWVQKRMIAVGYSNSHPLITKGVIDRELSRRVEIKIKTKAESVILSIQEAK